jgi:hypothetical protein
MSEQWACTEVPWYSVSSEGRVRNDKTGLILAPWMVKAGYLQIGLADKRFTVHALVAKAFCERESKGLVVNHRNGIRDDNRAENLEWVTPSENVKDGYRRGRVNPCQGKFSAEHPTSVPVISTCMSSGIETRYESAMDAVREGFDSSCISRCCHGQNAYHKGRYWRFGTEHGVKWADEAKAA